MKINHFKPHARGMIFEGSLARGGMMKMSEMIKKDHGPFPEELTRGELKNKVRDLETRLNDLQDHLGEVLGLLKRVCDGDEEPFDIHQDPRCVSLLMASVPDYLPEDLTEPKEQEDLREFISRMREKYGHKFDEYFANMEQSDDQYPDPNPCQK